MRKFFITAAALTAAFASTAAQALTVDFTDGVFTEVTASSIAGQPVVMTETAGGVTFEFTAIDNLVGAARFFPAASGLRVGGGGGSTIEFNLVVDTDVSFTSFGTDSTGFFLGAADFDLLDGAAILSEDNPLAQSATLTTLVDGPIDLTAGTTYTFDINNTGAGVQSFLTSLEFDVASTSAVPLPGTLPLATGALAMLGMVRLRQRRRR